MDAAVPERGTCNAHSPLDTRIGYGKELPSNPAETPPVPKGVVVTYAPLEHGFGQSHERATRIDIGKRLAALKGFAFVGEYDACARYERPVYFVPSDAIAGVDRARELGICSQHDLFGGVVPYAFVATKAVSHSLVDASAYAPTGWSHEFGQRVNDAVLFGFTAFRLEDARIAGARLLERGAVRLKPVRERGGRGQIVVSDAADLNAFLDALDPTELCSSGLVLEENLVDVTTYSVGQIRVADLLATYDGTQRLTLDNARAAVYGGSDLHVFRGDFEALLQVPPPDDVGVAIAMARAYDRAAVECFPGFFASRRNYDVVRGMNSAGEWRCGVLEQSWRIGGATSAEVAALEVFRAEPHLQHVRASTFEAYGECEPPPPHATVSFCGIDEQVGSITKYTLVWR